MKKILTIIVLSFSHLAFGLDMDSIYSGILNHFHENYLNTDIYENECVGLERLIDSSRVLINIDSTLGTTNYFEVIQLMEKEISQKMISKKDFYKQISEFNGKTIVFSDIQLPAIYSPATMLIPKHNQEDDFLRLYAPIEWNNKLYIQIWLKRNYYSSGTKVLYEVDPAGRILRTRKYNHCDDWG